jgi:hypothetical protein
MFQCHPRLRTKKLNWCDARSPYRTEANGLLSAQLSLGGEDGQQFCVHFASVFGFDARSKFKFETKNSIHSQTKVDAFAFVADRSHSQRMPV